MFEQICWRFWWIWSSLIMELGGVEDDMLSRYFGGVVVEEFLVDWMGFRSEVCRFGIVEFDIG